MRVRLMAVLLAGLACAPAMAQDTPSFEVGLGYAYLRDEDPAGAENFPLGWYADIAGNLNDWLGLVAEAGGSYKTIDAGGDDLKLSVHAFMGGPRLSRRGDGANVYLQLLAGAAQAKATFLGVSDSSTKFALQPGIGLELRMSEGLAFRVGGDYRLIFLEGEKGKEWRGTAGLVFRSGRR